MPKGAPIGGFHRAAGVPQLGLFIRDSLSNGQVTWAYRLWQEYKTSVLAIPLRRGKGPRKTISYDGFRRYLHAARKVDLIEYVTDPDTGDIDGSEAEVPSGDLKQPRLYFRMVAGADSRPDWSDIKKAAL